MLLALACSLFLLFCTLFALNASCSIRSLLQHALPASPRDPRPLYSQPDTYLIHGKTPYAELETFQPAEMTRAMLERCSVLAVEEKRAAEAALKAPIKAASKTKRA